jgi:tRNA A37 threonylcarbamoyladenosine synthetase subunit TsaC/SUA5/YrdC
LTWNLGDSKELGKVALRIPSNRFMTALLALSGPLAIANASLAKTKPPRDTNMIPALDKDLAYIIDAGELAEHPSGEGSTIVEIRSKELHVIREGAISVEELISTHPSVVRPSASSAEPTA